MKYLIVIAVLGAVFVGGYYTNQAKADQAENKYQELKKLDEQIFDDYRDAINQSVILAECGDNDYSCTKDVADKLYDIKNQVDSNHDKREALVE